MMPPRDEARKVVRSVAVMPALALTVVGLGVAVIFRL